MPISLTTTLKTTDEDAQEKLFNFVLVLIEKLGNGWYFGTSSDGYYMLELETTSRVTDISIKEAIPVDSKINFTKIVHHAFVAYTYQSFQKLIELKLHKFDTSANRTQIEQCHKRIAYQNQRLMARSQAIQRALAQSNTQSDPFMMNSFGGLFGHHQNEIEKQNRQSMANIDLSNHQKDTSIKANQLAERELVKLYLALTQADLEVKKEDSHHDKNKSSTPVKINPQDDTQIPSITFVFTVMRTDLRWELHTSGLSSLTSGNEGNVQSAIVENDIKCMIDELIARVGFNPQVERKYNYNAFGEITAFSIAFTLMVPKIPSNLSLILDAALDIIGISNDYKCVSINCLNIPEEEVTNSMGIKLQGASVSMLSQASMAQEKSASVLPTTVSLPTITVPIQGSVSPQMSSKVDEKALNDALVKFKLPKETALPSLEQALRRAAVFGSPEDINLLLDAGAKVNEPDNNPEKGFTALHWAVKEGEDKNVEALLMRGASRTIIDKSKRTAEEYITTATKPEIRQIFNKYRSTSSVAVGERRTVPSSSPTSASAALLSMQPSPEISRQQAPVASPGIVGVAGGITPVVTGATGVTVLRK